MRVGKWVRVYHDIVPIPGRMSMSFGLFENAELHLAPLTDVNASEGAEKYACEIIVSSVPIKSWPSVCRLSVRLHDTPRALAVATGFLRQQRINILLSECCSTYQGRAHFDAVCDLKQTPGYATVSEADHETYPNKMQHLLADLAEEYTKYAAQHPDAFLTWAPEHTKFEPLTGLNELSFLYSRDNTGAAHHRAGALRLPPDIVALVKRKCHLDPRGPLPHYALLTGNTEQRYMRILFVREPEYMFRLVVRNHLQRFAGSGAGVLHQFLSILPADVNLLRATNYIYDKTDDVESGLIDVIGYWHVPDEILHHRTFGEFLKEEFDALISSTDIRDLDERPHPKVLERVALHPATVSNPKVYISYSIGPDRSRLDALMTALSDNDYEVVLGTREDPDAADVASSAVWERAVSNIPKCIAFISLQTKREDYKVQVRRGKSRYIVPPWLTAEEMYAWSRDPRPYMVRLRAEEIYDSSFTRDLDEETYDSSDNEAYRRAVNAVVQGLNAFCTTDRFRALRESALKEQFEPRHTKPAV